MTENLAIIHALPSSTVAWLSVALIAATSLSASAFVMYHRVEANQRGAWDGIWDMMFYLAMGVMFTAVAAFPFAILVLYIVSFFV